MSGNEFEGRGVIVTGAGSGVGRAAALQFAEEGAKVLVADRRQESVRHVVKTIEYAGGTVRAVVGDLGDPNVVDEIVGTAVGAFGGSGRPRALRAGQGRMGGPGRHRRPRVATCP
ncbi:SDR family NAD(P)-dependent oxidoreductase [Streptomyces sp. CA-249302]|uniref:SDR family NAD(P)-dependent oxidoreductase n=1 Tax=Streptomyces sp. CA-249302 TaxID=3240058 RepID=UPI003D94DF43